MIAIVSTAMNVVAALSIRRVSVCLYSVAASSGRSIFVIVVIAMIAAIRAPAQIDKGQPIPSPLVPAQRAPVAMRAMKAAQPVEQHLDSRFSTPTAYRMKSRCSRVPTA